VEHRHLLSERITWYDTGEARWMGRARHGAMELSVRLNDWPAEPSYTVFVDGAAVCDLEEWPAAWEQVRRDEPGRPTAPRDG